MRLQLSRRITWAGLSQFLPSFFFLIIICISNLISPSPGHANDRNVPTPTPAAISPHSPDIVGGDIADTGEYPWQVALVASNYVNPYWGQFCGGTLIDTQWVLSAAHCVEDDGVISSPNSIDIVLGINKLSDGLNYGSAGQRIHVDAIYPYPGFHYGANGELIEDAALLHLKTPAIINSTVATITLASSADSSLFAPGVTSTVTGWGDTTEGGYGSNDLLEVQVPIVSYAVCAAGYAGEYQLTDAVHLCAGLAAGGKDSCQGDSGGPLIVPNGSEWMQAGIVSFGIGCAEPNYYGVYSRVSYFKPWIDLMTKGTQNPVYLPLVMKNASGSGSACTPDPVGDSDNVSDALIVCSGQAINGTTLHANDADDVYKIYALNGSTLTITMTGSGGDSDLYLFPPNTNDVNSDDWYYRSINYDNNEYISQILNETGFWYIDIYSPSSTTTTTNYQITVTATPP